jgi:hypothetical protein
MALLAFDGSAGVVIFHILLGGYSLACVLICGYFMVWMYLAQSDY